MELHELWTSYVESCDHHMPPKSLSATLSKIWKQQEGAEPQFIEPKEMNAKGINTADALLKPILESTRVGDPLPPIPRILWEIDNNPDLERQLKNKLEEMPKLT